MAIMNVERRYAYDRNMTIKVKKNQKKFAYLHGNEDKRTIENAVFLFIRR